MGNLNKKFKFKNLKFGTKFGFFLEIYQKNNYQFKNALMSFRSVSSDESNCIVLNLVCGKFQVSNSINVEVMDT